MTRNPTPISDTAAVWLSGRHAAAPELTDEQAELAQAEREAALREEWHAEQRDRRIRARQQHTPARYRTAELDDPQVKAWCDRLLPARRALVSGTVYGDSLVLLGATGRGKTHQAFGALRYLVEAGLPNTISVATTADLYAELRPRAGVDSEAVFTGYAQVGLLMLDDLGAAKSSEWVEEINYRLINHRYNNALPTVLTSNVPPAQLAAHLGERVASRLTEMATTVVLKGTDRRRGQCP
ncbi:ATP-binding protein [Amycolatopsis sp. NPDC059657]|uniref:ATP-binding protein n=1 Tax=Amycolatopsis sp. NPDC059657 TaxID=3346899 RepID=UPI00367153C4